MTRVSLVACFLLIAACNALPGPSAAPTQSALPSTPPTTAPTSTPAANTSQAVVKIEQVGGMLPVWEALRFYPSVALYSDGRLITQGPQIEIYPGPALPNLQVTRLTEAGLQQVLDWAAEAGLTGPDRQLGEPSFDAGQAVFTVTTPAGTHRSSVPDMSLSDADVGALRQFQDLMMNVRPYLGDDVVGDDQPYAFERLRISAEADPAVAVDPDLSSTLQWPLHVPLSKLGVSLSEPAQYRCREISGEDLAEMMPLLEQANELTMWESERTPYVLQLRPLLPDEEACPSS